MNKDNKKTLYFECYSGISGDMAVSALLDLGADERELRRQLATLPVDGFKVEISRVKKSGLDCCDFNVVLEEKYQNHDHDTEYLYGHRKGHTHEHSDGQEHTHMHSDVHVHRGLGDVLEIINHSGMNDRAKKTAADIFYVLACAEAKAHGSTIENVHFHEVGAIDSIVDIASVAICLDNLDVTEVIVPELYEGRGTVRCAHGILPIPVPAVMNIAAEHGLAMHITNVEAELVTPTGAAIVAAVRTSDRLPEKYTIVATGLGAGKRDYERTSILRAMIIEEDKKSPEDSIYKLESNIDDCTGEVLGYVMERLLEKGARDVNYTPVFMKKNRPAYQINIICTQAEIPAMEEVLFKETTTIGIRRILVERTTLPREIRTVQTAFGEADIKICDVYGEKRIYPEYKSAAAIAKRTGLSYKEAWEQILKEAQEKGI